jgi:tripartite-type tricarboxylate transporter receptor subunit TctC
MLKTDSRIEDATGPSVVRSATLARNSRLCSRMRNRLALTVIVSLMCLPAAAHSQAFPSKPIRLVVPFQAGGGNDLLARIISQKFLEKWGQPVIVDNRPGAGGNLGADFVAKAAPDGYTILLGTNTLTMNPFIFAKMPFDTQKDLAPVAMLATTPFYVVVNNNLPVKNIPELIAYAKANPGKLSYATPGIGTPHHLGTELFKSMTGTYMVHIPYKGSIPALTDVIGGQVQVMWATVNVALPMVTSGKVRGLALAEPKRTQSLKDVPVIAETVPGYEVSAWYGIFAPPGTSPAIVQQMSAELQHIFQQPDVQARLLPLGYEISTANAEQLRATVAGDLDKWGKLVKTVGIKPE